MMLILGLGLYSLAKRMEALKGKYGVQHRQDGKQGSLFWFEIPYRPDSMAASSSLFANPFSPLHSTAIALLQSSQQMIAKVESTFQGSPGKPPFIPPFDPAIRTQMDIADCNRSDNLVGSSALTLPSHLSDNMVSASISLIANNAVSTELNFIRNSFSKSAFNTAATPSGSNFPKETFKVLLVDDSPSIMKMITMMLRLKGHEVITAENGSIALTLLNHHQHAFDVILMDLQMPIMDGLETTRRIRYLEQQDNTSSYYQSHQLIIGMSGNSDQETMEASYLAGMDDFMIKPFHMDSFLNIVHQQQLLNK